VLLARAAAEATAKLEGKPLPAPAERPWVSAVGFLEALPKETRFAMDAPTGLGKGGPTSVSDFLKSMFATMGGGGAEADQMARMATQEIASMAVKYGNFRIDRVALANVGGVGPSGGGLGIFLLGEYHRDVLERGLAAEASTWTVEEVEGYKLFKSREVRLVALDDHAVLLLPDEGSVSFPVPEYLKALKAGAKPLRGEKRWDQFLGTLGGKAFLRGLAVTDETLMSEFYREIDGEGSVPQPVKDALKGMSEIEADIREAEGNKLAYRTEAVFGIAEQDTAMADFVKQGIQMGIQEIEGQLGQLAGSPMESMAKQVVDILKGIRVVADGKKGILRGEADPSILMQGFSGVFGMGGMR
jgi:hypothetical protein